MSDTPQMARFRTLVRELLEQGIAPTPSEILKRQGEGDNFANPATRTGGAYLSHGRLSKVRTEEFEAAGWTQREVKRVGKVGRWVPPVT